MGYARNAGEDHGTVQACLRSIGVLGNKHIPAVYLRASEPQRRALLAGLLDTDGYCAKAGRIEYYSTCEQLARDVYHLVATLGYKASLRSKTARLHGKDCGTVWTVVFTTADKVFRLSRKASRQVTKMSATSGRRYVTAIRPVASVPVRCIAVDSPSHLYLAGESCIPTHNSVFAQLIAGQLRYKDGICLIIDHQLFSDPWALKGMPNVVYAGTEEEIHLALLWLAQEIKDRKQAARKSIDMRGRVRADVGLGSWSSARNSTTRSTRGSRTTIANRQRARSSAEW